MYVCMYVCICICIYIHICMHIQSMVHLHAASGRGPSELVTAARCDVLLPRISLHMFSASSSSTRTSSSISGNGAHLSRPKPCYRPAQGFGPWLLHAKLNAVKRNGGGGSKPELTPIDPPQEVFSSGRGPVTDVASPYAGAPEGRGKMWRHRQLLGAECAMERSVA